MQWSMYQAVPLADRSYQVHWSLIEIRTRAPNGTFSCKQLPRNQSILGSSRAFKSYLSCRKEGREQRLTSLQWNRSPWEAKPLQGMWHFKPPWAQGGVFGLFIIITLFFYLWQHRLTPTPVGHKKLNQCQHYQKNMSCIAPSHLCKQPKVRKNSHIRQ